MTETKLRHGVHYIPPDQPVPTGADLCPDLTAANLCCWAIQATANDWLLIQAERSGQPIQFRAMKRDGTRTDWITGTVSSTFWYDGLSARLIEHDPDDRIEWKVWSDRDEFRLLSTGEDGCGC